MAGQTTKYARVQNNIRHWVTVEGLNKDFISLCLSEIAKFGYQGISLQSQSWATIRGTLAQRYPDVFRSVGDKLKFQKFIKNHWNVLKKKYTAYRLCMSITGNVYDESTGPFKDAYGAIDGTCINAVVPKEKQPVFRGRGGKDIFQNVMGVCDFNMLFTYVVVGWEGVAHDSRVLTAAVRNPTFKFPFPPEGKYYLCDATYAHTKGFMVPYRGKRYWLKDFRKRGRPRDKEERFNHPHSQLRNVIERTFGVLKKRYPMLDKGMPSYSFSTHKQIVVACMTLHNFLRRFVKDDQLFKDFVTDDVQVHDDDNDDDSDEEPETFETNPQNQFYAAELRNQIANEIDALSQD